VGVRVLKIWCTSGKTGKTDPDPHTPDHACARIVSLVHHAHRTQQHLLAFPGYSRVFIVSGSFA
jgi:hypothetical protein